MTTPAQPMPGTEPAATDGPRYGIGLEPPPPALRAPSVPTKRYSWIGVGIVAALIFAGVGYYALTIRNHSAADQARLACEEGVKGKLVSPSSADFSNVSVMSSATSPSTFTVIGTVDSDNEGVSIRNYFTCETALDGGIWKYRITELTR